MPTKQTHKMVMILTAIAIVMFCFSFAVAPLYRQFCKVTGINTALTEKEFFKKEDATRSITIQFLATNNENLSWEFYPIEKTVVVHPNQIMRIYFHAKNTTKKDMTVQAIPSYTPTIAARYFHKIECFCFRQQTLKAGESKEMPVVFRVDSELPSNIHTITLAYTLFDIKRT